MGVNFKNSFNTGFRRTGGIKVCFRKLIMTIINLENPSEKNLKTHRRTYIYKQIEYSLYWTSF